jgi:hypothetical protein
VEQSYPLVVNRKNNARSSIAAELVGVDDVIGSVLWSNRFFEAQGYGDTKGIILQDNKSAIIMENDGRKSSSKRSCHFNIRKKVIFKLKSVQLTT